MQITIVHDCREGLLPPDESDTLLETEQVESALVAAGNRVDRVRFSLDIPLFETLLMQRKPDLVFNLAENRLVHLVPACCESLGIRCTGSSARALYLSTDKVLAKRLMLLAGLPTPPWVGGGRTEDANLLAGIPVIVKPTDGEGSVGIGDGSVRVFESAADLVSFVEGKPLFAERYVEGREFSVSILSVDGEPVVLPPAQLQFLGYPEGKPRIAGYEAKWEKSSFAYSHTARTFAFSESDGPLLSRLMGLSLAVWELFSATGYARVDFRVDGEGKAWVLEANMNPCIADDSGFVAACNEAQISYARMIDLIVRG